MAAKAFPTPAVTAIARAPQKVTRSTAGMTDEPPVRAPNAPSAARQISDTIPTVGASRCGAASGTTATGAAAPVVKASAEAKELADEPDQELDELTSRY